MTTMAIDNKDKKVLNVPLLRFPEFTDEWKESVLSDFVERVKRKNKNNLCKLPLTISAQYGLVDQISFFNKVIASENMSNYYLLHKGDFAYNKSYSSEYPWGAIKRLDCYEQGTLSSLYICFKPYSHVSSDFLTHYFETSKWHQGISEIAVEGARNHGLLNVGIQDFFETRHCLPQSLLEQEKIAKFLNLIEERIATQNKIIEDLKKLKCAIIDYTFDNKTQSHRKRILLSDVSAKITRRNTDNQNFNVLSNSANQGIIPQNEVFDREIANENNTSNYFVISQNDFVYNPRKSVTAPYGPINRYNGETNGVISPLYLCFRCYGIDVEYLGWYFKSDSWHKYVYQNGDTGVRHDRVSIKDEIFFSMPLYLHSTEEQMEIAKRLNKIESFVSQEEKYLFLLRSQKLYLLQQMFI